MAGVLTHRYTCIGFKLAWAERIEDGMLGIRIWREV